jgi:hypothetical protein
MRATIVGLIVYCALCIVVLFGFSLYQEIKHNRAIEELENENIPASIAADVAANQAPLKPELKGNRSSTRRAA